MDFEANLGAAMMAESADIFSRHAEMRKQDDAMVSLKSNNLKSYVERRARKACDSCGTIRPDEDFVFAKGHMRICKNKPECAQRALNWARFVRGACERF